MLGPYGLGVFVTLNLLRHKPVKVTVSDACEFIGRRDDAVLGINSRTFGKAVRERRLKVEISQEELASLAQVERSHMGKIERGEHMPNFVLILKLAKALAVTPGQLVDRAVQLM